MRGAWRFAAPPRDRCRPTVLDDLDGRDDVLAVEAALDYDVDLPGDTQTGVLQLLRLGHRDSGLPVCFRTEWMIIWNGVVRLGTAGAYPGARTVDLGRLTPYAAPILGRSTDSDEAKFALQLGTTEALIRTNH